MLYTLPSMNFNTVGACIHLLAVKYSLANNIPTGRGHYSNACSTIIFQTHDLSIYSCEPIYNCYNCAGEKDKNQDLATELTKL